MSKVDIDKQLFKDTRNWFFNFVRANKDDTYQLSDIECVQIKNILKRIQNVILKKDPDCRGDVLNSRTFTAFNHIVSFAFENNYTITALNIITKWENIKQGIINAGRKPNKINGGFNPETNNWYNPNQEVDLHERTGARLTTGAIQISHSTAGNDK